MTISLDELAVDPAAPKPKGRGYTLDELTAPAAPPEQSGVGDVLMRAFERQNDPVLQKEQARKDTHFLVRAGARGVQQALGGAEMASATSTDSARTDVLRYDEITRLIQQPTYDLAPGDIDQLNAERKSILSRYPAHMQIRISDARRRPELIKELGASSLSNIQSVQERHRIVETRFPASLQLENAIKGPEKPVTGLPAQLGWKNADEPLGDQLDRFWGEFTKAPLSMIGELGVQSLPTIVGALGVGLLTRNPALAGATMGGLSGLQEYGGALTEIMQEKGVDVTKPEAVLAALRDPVLGAEIRSTATAKAIPIAALDALSMRLAGVTMAPRGMGPVARQAVNVPAQIAAQGIAGGTGEALGQLAAYGKIKSAGEIAAEVVAEAFGAPANIIGMRAAMRGEPAAPGATPKASAAATVAAFLNRQIQALGFGRQAEAAPAAEPAAPPPVIPPEVQAVLEANGITPGDPRYVGAVDRIMQRLAAEAQRPAPDAFNVPSPDASPQGAAKALEAAVDAQRAALARETAAREAVAAGMTTFQDPETGNEVSTARAPVIPRTEAPPVIALPKSPDFVPGRNAEETARVADVRQRDAALAAASEEADLEAQLAFLRRLETGPRAEQARGPFQYADETRRPLAAAETLSPEALRLAEASGRRPDQPVKPGAAAAFERFAINQQRAQAEADNADRNSGPFRVGDTSSSEPRPGLGTDAPSAPQDAARILREREALQRERDFALGQATNQTITDTERAKWRKKAEALGPQIDALSARLDDMARRAGQYENKGAPTKEKVLDKEGASVATGTSDRPFRAKSTQAEARYEATPQDRTRFSRAVGIPESQIDTNAMTRAIFQDWLRGERERDARAAVQQEQTFEQDTRSTFERLRDRRIEELEAEWERNRTKGRAERQSKEEQAAAEERAGTTPKGLDKDGNYFVDERGFVLSDKGGPILFQSQREAGTWILKHGNKQSRDQVFDIANHPDVFGKFSVQERMRRKPQAKPDDGPPSPSRGALVPAGAPPKRGPSSGAAPRAAAFTEEETAPPAENTGAPAKLPKEAKGSGIKIEGKPLEKTEPLRAPDSFKPTPQQMGRARSILARIRGSGPKKKPQRLIDAIIAAGGVRPDSMGADSLRAMDLHKRPGFFSNKGHSVDDLTLSMREFSPKYGGATDKGNRAEIPRMSIDELLELISDDAGTRPVYRPDDAATADFFAKEAELDAWIGWLEENKIATTIERPKDLAWLLSLEPWEARLRTLLRSQVYGNMTEEKSLEAAALLDREIAAADEAEYRSASQERPEGFGPELEAYDGADQGRQVADAAPEGTASPEGARAQGSDAQRAPAPEQQPNADAQADRAADRGAERAGEPRDDGQRGAAERVDAPNRVSEARATDDKPAGKPAAPARPTVDKTDQGEQPVIPGAERLTEQEMQKRELAKRAAEGKMKPKVRQERADDGLFDVAGRGQEDMFAKKPEAPKAEKPKEEPHDGMTPGAAAAAKQYKNDTPGILGAIGEAHAEVKSLAAKIQAGDKSAATQKAFEDANQQLADLEDAYEWMEQTEAEREASRLAGKFHSNPMMDPAAWASFFRMVDPRKVGRFFAEEAKAWAEQFQRVAELFSKSSRRQKGNPALDLLRTIAYSNDGMLMVLAHRYKVGDKANPVIQEFRRLWHAQPGRQGETGIAQTYGEAVSERTQSRLNDLVKILEPLKGMDGARSKAILETVARKMRAKNIALKPTTQVDKIAAGLRDFFADELKYLRGAGIDMGKVEGYLPRAPDMTLVHSNLSAFTEDAVKAYRANGLPEKDAREAAGAWLDRLLMGDMGISAADNDLVLNQTGSVKPSFEKGRELGRAAEKIMEKWYIQDPVELAADYAVRATRRGELAKRLGPKLEKWGEFKEKLAESGAIEALPEIIDITRSTAGLYPGIRHRGMRHTFAFLRLLTPLTYLERATITSLSEPTIIGARQTGLNPVRDLIPIDTLTAYLKTVGALINRARGHKTATVELAEDLGLIGDAAHGTMMQQRFGGQVDTKWAQEIMAGFFKKTALHDFTDSTRQVALGVGRVFLRRLALRANDATDHPVWGTRKSTETLLGELGVPADKIKEFSAWILKAPNGMPVDDAVRDVDTKDPMARLYRSALTRFVDQTIMRPKPAERQRWANHPVGGVFYGITSFISSFHKNVLMRGLSMAGQSVSPKSGLSAYERFAFLMPITRLAVTTVAAQFALTFLRDALWDDPAKDPEKKRELDKEGKLGVTRRMMLAISRSGLLGLWDIPYNWAFASKYTKDPASVAAGPALSGVGELVKSFVNLASERNSPDTNTAERAATRAVFEYFVSPVMNAMFSLMPGRVGSLIGAAGIQATTHPKFQEDMIQRPLWGPPRWQTTGGTSSRGGRETRSGRGSSR